MQFSIYSKLLRETRILFLKSVHHIWITQVRQCPQVYMGTFLLGMLLLGSAFNKARCCNPTPDIQLHVCTVKHRKRSGEQNDNTTCHKSTHRDSPALSFPREECRKFNYSQAKAGINTARWYAVVNRTLLFVFNMELFLLGQLGQPWHLYSAQSLERFALGCALTSSVWLTQILNTTGQEVKLWHPAGFSSHQSIGQVHPHDHCQYKVLEPKLGCPAIKSRNGNRILDTL